VCRDAEIVVDDKYLEIGAVDIKDAAAEGTYAHVELEFEPCSPS